LIGYAETAAAHLLEKGIGALSVERASGLGEGLTLRASCPPIRSTP